MTPLPRRVCKVCGKSVPVRRNGALREHIGAFYAVGDGPPVSMVCPMSGKKS